MEKDSQIYVAGHRGLVGSAIVRRLLAAGHSPQSLVLRTHQELDLTDQRVVHEFFATERPEYVFLAAAKVGGIYANNTYPADFVYKNLVIEANIIHAAYLNKVKKLLFLGSSCIYPKHAPQPMKEEYLLTGPLEPTNEPYAIAKIAGIKMCAAYNRQYGTNFISTMPTNLYGLGDNFDLQNSHVLPALIRKMHEAKERGDAQAVVWGTGTPRREFLYSDDLADACLFLMENVDARDAGEFINIGVGHDVTIREAAELVAETVGFTGRLVFDAAKPDGAPQKLLDITRLSKLGWCARTAFKEGVRRVYDDFLQTTSAKETLIKSPRPMR